MPASTGSEGETDLGDSGGAEDGSVPTAYIADLYHDGEGDGDTSSLSSSPQSSTNNFGAFSTTEPSSDDDTAAAKPLPTSFSTSSLRDALDALDALESTNLQLPDRSAAPSLRGLLIHSRSDPNPAQLSPERTPTAGAFTFPPPKSVFVNDPEPSNLDICSPIDRPPSPTPTAPMLIPISIRPAITHRKTHSGTIHSGTIPASAGGIQKRNAPASIRVVYQNQNQHQGSSTDLGGGWGTKDVVGLAEEAGLRVSDFRTALHDEVSEATTPTSHTRSTSPIVHRVGERRGSVSRRVPSTPLSRTNSGARSRHSRASSKSSGSPLINSSPVVPSAHPPPAKRTAVGMSGQELLARLEGAERRGGKGPDDLPLLVVDVRTLSAFLGDSGRIRTSVNVNFPSLLIKRFRKGNTSNFSLNAFVTTENGKALFHFVTKNADPPGTLNGVDIIVVDQWPDTRDQNSTSPGSVLLSVLERREERGSIYFLQDPFPSHVADPRWSRWIVAGEGEVDDELPVASSSNDIDMAVPKELRPGASRGLLTLQPSGPTRATSPGLPKIVSGQTPFEIPRPPRTPSPSASRTPSPKTPGGTPRAVPPKLRRIDTSDDLLGLRKATSPRASRTRSKSPAGRSSPPSGGRDRATLGVDVPRRSGSGPISIQALCHVQSKSPTTNRFSDVDLDPPRTARPGTGGDSPSSAGGHRDVPPFVVSTIIPDFLYLGPEPTRKEDLDELQRRGVKQILNLALECEDADGEMARRFDRVWKIPMRDFVEETGVQRSIEEACRILADAQLQSKPIYCHCRAGKSRSVTIVLAYLVHRNNWSLKRAYAHVSERRKGISPNIGFVAELMKWEERERGGKSHGVFGPSSSMASTPRATSFGQHPPPLLHAATSAAAYFPSISPGDTDVDDDRGAAGRARGGDRGRVRDSLPPGPAMTDLVGAEGEREMEVRAMDGTWAPARRDPRDANSNPLRRASRAGLESGGGFPSWGD